MFYLIAELGNADHEQRLILGFLRAFLSGDVHFQKQLPYGRGTIVHSDRENCNAKTQKKKDESNNLISEPVIGRRTTGPGDVPLKPAQSSIWNGKTRLPNNRRVTDLTRARERSFAIVSFAAALSIHRPDGVL